MMSLHMMSFCVISFCVMSYNFITYDVIHVRLYIALRSMTSCHYIIMMSFLCDVIWCHSYIRLVIGALRSMKYMEMSIMERGIK